VTRKATERVRICTLFIWLFTRYIVRDGSEDQTTSMNICVVTDSNNLSEKKQKEFT